MTKEQREQLRLLKQQINHPKSELLDLLGRIEEISPRQAEKLGAIIGRLEDWQNR